MQLNRIANSVRDYIFETGEVASRQIARISPARAIQSSRSVGLFLYSRTPNRRISFSSSVPTLLVRVTTCTSASAGSCLTARKTSAPLCLGKCQSSTNERMDLDGIRSTTEPVGVTDSTPTVINRLRKLAIYGQPQLSLEHQGRAKRYVVRGVESGGANEEVGYYVTFAGESGDALAWLQTLDSLTVNGPHAVVIAPVLTRIEMLRIARTYELCITRHKPVTVATRQRPRLEAEQMFHARHGYLALELWGKDKELTGCVRPQFFTRSGEEVELPIGFDEAVKAATRGANCLACSHPHFSRLVAQEQQPPPAHEEEQESSMSADVASLAQGAKRKEIT